MDAQPRQKSKVVGMMGAEKRHEEAGKKSDEEKMSAQAGQARTANLRLRSIRRRSESPEYVDVKPQLERAAKWLDWTLALAAGNSGWRREFDWRRMTPRNTLALLRWPRRET